MANHKSALKRIRQSESRRLLNKYQHKTLRNSVRALLSETKKKDAAVLFPKVVCAVMVESSVQVLWSVQVQAFPGPQSHPSPLQSQQ